MQIRRLPSSEYRLLQPLDQRNALRWAWEAKRGSIFSTTFDSRSWIMADHRPTYFDGAEFACNSGPYANKQRAGSRSPRSVVNDAVQRNHGPDGTFHNTTSSGRAARLSGDVVVEIDWCERELCDLCLVQEGYTTWLGHGAMVSTNVQRRATETTGVGVHRARKLRGISTTPNAMNI